MAGWQSGYAAACKAVYAGSIPASASMVLNMFNKKSILITGGTGSFGKRFLSRLLEEKKLPKKIIIFSRDELKQHELKLQYPQDQFPMLRFFIGDIRDKDRLSQACEGVDIIIHAAALKQVDTAEYNPSEFIKTNVIGAENIIFASLKNNVSDIVALSTDKACAPTNLYGASKLMSDKLFTAANNTVGARGMKFSVVRYGNVLGSRGSVIPFFLANRSLGELPVTNINMTRFNISLDDGVNMVFFALKNHLGGEIFVPKIPSYKISDVVEAVAPKASIKIIGIRPGEKLHEEMISDSDSYNTIDIGKYYAILPSVSLKLSNEEYKEHHGGIFVDEGFKYNSELNTKWETPESLREQIKLHIDPNFEILK